MPEAARPNAVLAVIGDANDPATFSGTPFYCLQAGRAAGFLDTGLVLGADGSAWRLRRIAWNFARVLITGRGGGFQYSRAFTDALWRQDEPGPSDTVLSMFQLVPDRVIARRGKTVFYIDQTLSQMFEGYGLDHSVPKAVQADAIARERKQYFAASAIICQSKWAARDVVERYGVPQSRVHAVVPGANLTAGDLASWESRAAAPQPRAGLRLIFVGKDWERKGLGRLVRALALARAQGADAVLTVVGAASDALPSEISAAPGVSIAGFIDKRRDADRFMDLLATADAGCLLSHAEAGGMSLREFARLGLTTIAPDVGGAPEYVVPGASELVAPDASDEFIAAILVRLARDPAALLARRRTAWAARGTADWSQAAKKLAEFLPTGHPAALTRNGNARP